MFLTRIQDKIKEIFGHNSLDWLNISYSIDWAVATSFWFLGDFVSRLPVFQRDFSPDDSTISHKHVTQQISGYTNNLIALFVPLIITTAVGTFKKSAIEIHHAALALWTGRSLTHLVTECLKNRVGRLRPDFLSRCRWDTALAACTGKADSIRDGRESFPSGHSSTAFAGMTFLALWIAGQTAAWCFSIPTPSGTLVRTRMCRFVVCLLPLAYSTWVAISRLEDYRHHKEDIIVGALIGALCSSICYFMYWPSPFSAASFNSEQVGRPRVDYAAYDYPERRSGSYQLTRLQDDTEHV